MRRRDTCRVCDVALTFENSRYEYNTGICRADENEQSKARSRRSRQAFNDWRARRAAAGE